MPDHRAYIAEIGATGLTATIAVAVLYAAAELLQPGLGANALSIEAIMIAAAVFLACTVAWPERKRSIASSIAFGVLALAGVAAVSGMAWTFFATLPDAQLPLTLAAGFAAAMLFAATA